MQDLSDWKATAPYDFGAGLPSPVEDVSAASPRTIRLHAIQLLLNRGFVYVGEDSVGLPCFRSRSGAMLIGVGSCRCLAYAKVDGRLQVVAAARTLSLLCRIPDRTGSAESSAVRSAANQAQPAPASDLSPRPEPVLVL